MASILLIGNGPSYFSGRFGWTDALRVAAHHVRMANEVERLVNEPLPLVFEAVLSRYPKAERRIKAVLASQLDLMRPNHIHSKLMALDWPVVMTTNYDHCLESAKGGVFETSNIEGETTYSLFRRRATSSRTMWHIHGEYRAPRTMLLGFHQYAGYLQKLRRYMTTKAHGSRFIFAKDFDEREDRHSWADLFLRDHVHIVGLGLGYGETVLWWLLSFKQRLSRIRHRSIGTTTYYLQGEPVSGDRRIQLLASYGVRIRHIVSPTRLPTEGTWERVANMLRHVDPLE